MKRNRGKRRILAVVLTIALAAGSLMVSSPVKAFGAVRAFDRRTGPFREWAPRNQCGQCVIWKRR